MKVRAYLAVIAAATLVPIVLFAAFALESVLREERTAALGAVQETARLTATGVDREIASSLAALRVLASSVHLVDGRLAQFYEQAAAANAGAQTWTVLFDRDGRQLVNTRAPFGTALPQRRHPERGEEVIRTQRPYVSGLTTSRTAGRYVVNVNAPVPLAGGTRYVLGQAFQADYFLRALPQRPLPDGWAISIIDRDGNVIVRSGSADATGKRVPAELLAAMWGQPEGEVTRRENNAERIDVYARSGLSGWTVAVSVPPAAIDGGQRRAAG
ncbi:hypothetical protein E4K72_05415, partial [Oxalobacteraceae bacterium OM1]